ncbi:MAG: glycosyltransferase [Bdellovibrionales bacterium]
MLTFIASLGLLAWLYLDVFHGKFWKPLFPAPAGPPESWPSVDIIVPARNEAAELPKSLPSLFAQDYPGNWRIILVDDHSTDGTAAVARQIARDKNADSRLAVISAPDLPPDWTNPKLHALHCGLGHSSADFILFTDADIMHHPKNLSELVARAVANRLHLVSLMVKLHCVTFAEKLLIPAFIFFFEMLFPFRRANDPASKTAAAAGGVILAKRSALEKIGGLGAIKSQLIDDCALASAVKNTGGLTELTLSRDVVSMREYPKTGDVMRMISRTAFTQLRYSSWRLIATVIGMFILFSPPLLALAAETGQGKAMGLLAWAIMSILYLPTILFYGLPFYWALTLPAAAVIYILATIDSARLYWQGKGGQWKGRIQAG